MGDGLEVLIEMKRACPFDENPKDNDRGWLWALYNKAFRSKSINVRHYVQGQAHMLAANIYY